jgi:hypothetical protein
MPSYRRLGRGTKPNIPQEGSTRLTRKHTFTADTNQVLKQQTTCNTQQTTYNTHDRGDHHAKGNLAGV